MDMETPEVKDEEAPGKKLSYPKRIFLIIAMEACERFSYYGMNAILTVYLIFLLKRTWPDDEDKAADVSSIIYHFFKFGCYATGLLGATLADSYVGKYRTIFYIGLVYALGQAILALGAVGRGEGGIENFPNQPVSFLGIFLIAVGTGGIKPCVVALGADQFKVPEQKEQMSTYFAWFYASINFGSLIATIVTPLLRRFECMGEDSCFSLAFGLPALLMCIALFFFWSGRNHYTGKKPEKNVIVEFFQASWYAMRGGNRETNGKVEHWLDRANDRYDKQTLDDLKAVYRVGLLFLFYPVYWALYDQQGSRWTIQAMKMNGYTFGVLILPDQMQVANPILILLLIPLFDQVIYPLLGKVGVLKTPLQRIVTGCFLCGLSFVISGVLELELRKGYPTLPESQETKLFVHNSLDCNLNIVIRQTDLEMADFSLPPLMTSDPILKRGDYQMHYNCEGQSISTYDFSLKKESASLVVWGQDQVYRSNYRDDIDKDTEDPMPYIRLVSTLSCSTSLSASMTWKDDKQEDFVFDQINSPTDSEKLKLEHSGMHQLTVLCGDEEVVKEDLDLLLGGSYSVYLDNTNTVTVYTVVSPNSVHIFWLLPQYFVITVGEILFSITSLEFAYSQAPASMKSVLQALYLLTTAFGNLITMLVVEVFSALGLAQYLEFFTFAGLMTVFSLILAGVSYKYQYVYYTGEPESEDNVLGDEKDKKDGGVSEGGSPGETNTGFQPEDQVT